MDLSALLTRATEAGLRVAVEGDALIVRGPRSAAPIAQEIGRHANEITLLLEADQAVALGALCDRCGAPPEPRLPIHTYWGEMLCPACCARVVADFDATDTWPPVPW